MKTLAAIKWRYSLDALFIFCVMAIVWIAGTSHLDGWNGPAGSLTNDLFIPAIMMNAGHGFTNMDPATIPELRSFLDFQAAEFDITQIPDNVQIQKLHPYQEFHRYLIYSVALAWRCNGVTWDTVKLLLLLYFFFSCLALYGICRLGMNPVLSILVVIAFAYSPPVSLTLPILRDFAKAPFILAIAFLLGVIVFRPLRSRYFLLLALLIGALLGAGMGIRRDMMVFLPASVVFLFFGTIQSSRNTLPTRFLAIALLLASFMIAGWPVHKSFMREGYLAAHDTIMGFSSFSDHELGLLKPASYEKHYLLNDMYSTVKAHYAAGMGVTFPKSTYQKRAAEPDFDVEVKQAYVRSVIMTFPSDMLTRAYAAVMRITVGIIQTPFRVETYGLWLTCIGLLLIASQSPLRAWLLLAMLCYFCGYTSIQFAVRHAFHTSFVPFFFLGFILQHAFPYALKKLGMIKQAAMSEETVTEPTAILCRRAAVWAFVTLALFCMPLLAAQHVQQSKVETLRHIYESAELDPVDYKIMTWDGRPLVAPTESIRAEGFEGKCLLADFETGILVALFEDASVPLELRAVYEWEGGIGDFGGPLTASVWQNGQACPAKYYFPVHEKTVYGTDWSRFVGLAMSEEAAASFRGLCRVKDLSSFGLLVNMLIPDDRERFLCSEELLIPWQGATWSPYFVNANPDPTTRAMNIREYIKNNDPIRAIQLATETLQQRPGSITFTTLLVEALDHSGATDQAHKICVELLTAFPNIQAAHAQLDHYFDRQGGAQRRFEAWSAILATEPALPLAAEYLTAATSDMNTSE